MPSRDREPPQPMFWDAVETSPGSDLPVTTQTTELIAEGGKGLSQLEEGRYRRRVLHVERINTLLRNICFDEAIRDRVPKKVFVAMGQMFWYMYHAFTADTIVLDWVPEQTKHNRGLRWHMMGRIWLILQEHVFDQLEETDRNPLDNPLLIVMRDIVAEKIRQFILPFKRRNVDCTHLDAMVDQLCADAKRLLYMLLEDNKATYSFFIAGDPRELDAQLSLSLLRDRVKKVDLCGASHTDASRDVVAICMAGGLQRHTEEESIVETKALVLLYRPGEDESVPTSAEAIRARDAMINWGKLPAGWKHDESE